MRFELQVFLALLVAHLIGDFPLQSRCMVDGKTAFSASAYLRHGLIHLATATLALALFLPAAAWRWATIYALLFLTVGHLALDLSKSVAVRFRPGLEGASLFAADQLAHVAIVALATAIVAGNVPDLSVVTGGWRAYQDQVLVLSTVLLLFLFPVGYLIRYLLDPFSEELVAADEAFEGLTNAGLYIGMLERALLIIAFAVGSMTAVGLIVGAKSIVRYPRFQSRAFAEYFLIGTLLSVGSAALGGWLLRSALAQLPVG